MNSEQPEGKTAEDLHEMGFINGHPDRNYEEDFEHENGNYMNKCRECELYFRGHKRRIICKQCFNAQPDWLKLSKKQPPKEIKNNAWPGCWADGEMTGFARCMVQKVQPLEAELKASQELNRELLPMAEYWYKYLKTFESWAEDDDPKPEWVAKLPGYKAILDKAKLNQQPDNKSTDDSASKED